MVKGVKVPSSDPIEDDTSPVEGGKKKKRN
jgi:hypothetical protein